MAETKAKKKRLSINLSFLTFSDSTKRSSARKSAKKFEEPNGVVGLGILAALNDHHHQNPVFINGCRTAVSPISPRSSSNPISILSNASFSKSGDTSRKLSIEEMELCEEYTRVICHVGQNFIKEREYSKADCLGNNNGSQRVSGAVSAPFKIADFLNSCFLCEKLLHGLDIFMYRGDKAFCSAECRLTQISMDEQKEKWHSGVWKPMKYSVSPLQFLAGIAAA